MAKKASTEATVRNIRRRAKQKYSAEEKIRSVLEGLRGIKRSLSSAAGKRSTRTCITAGAKISWKRGKHVW